MEIQTQHKRNVFNLAFTFLFVGLITAQLVTLWQLEKNPSLDLTDFILLSLGLFRLTRLFVYDGATQFIRDLFVDISEKRKTLTREKKDFGLQRCLSDIFSCPWCFSMWGGSIYVWTYIMYPTVMLYVSVILALSAVATVLQLGTNLLGWKAEHEKKLVEKL